MAETPDELSIEWTDDDGNVTTTQLDKVILSRGAWATIMFLYQDLDRKTGELGPSKVRIQRYQKRDGHYMPRSKFNISSPKQARAILETLERWFVEG